MILRPLSVPFLILSLAASLSLGFTGNKTVFQEGDILFQSSNSTQAKAIELATHSQYSHVGIIVKKDGRLMVLEAVQPVRYMDIEDWIHSGKNGVYVQKRLVNAGKLLTASVREKLEVLGDSYAGKNYDYYFSWDDKDMYCSELVWKLYKKAAGVEVGQLRKFKDYDFSSPVVKDKLKKRFGKNVPMDETIVSPQDIFNSTSLVTVSSK